jgi:hypothetical protein
VDNHPGPDPAHDPRLAESDRIAAAIGASQHCIRPEPVHHPQRRTLAQRELAAHQQVTERPDRRSLGAVVRGSRRRPHRRPKPGTGSGEREHDVLVGIHQALQQRRLVGDGLRRVHLVAPPRRRTIDDLDGTAYQAIGRAGRSQGSRQPAAERPAEQTAEVKLGTTGRDDAVDADQGQPVPAAGGGRGCGPDSRPRLFAKDQG